MITKLDLKIHRRHIWYNRQGQSMLNVQLKKALYVTLKAALLFWNLLSGTLQDWGFKLNLYDKCVANQNINNNNPQIYGMLIKMYHM